MSGTMSPPQGTNHNLCFHLAGLVKAKKERKTFLKGPVTRNITHLFDFARVATAGINNIPMKKTPFWASTGLDVAFTVSTGPCSALNVAWILVSIRF